MAARPLVEPGTGTWLTGVPASPFKPDRRYWPWATCTGVTPVHGNISFTRLASSAEKHSSPACPPAATTESNAPRYFKKAHRISAPSVVDNGRASDVKVRSD